MKTARTIILATLTACRLFAGETAKVAANASADFGDYTYDGAGNITGAGADRFTYDQYGRIKAAALTRGSNTIAQSFAYDRYGNLLSIATTGDPTLVPAVDPLTNRIDKLTATTNAFGSYDPNGNLTSYNSSSSFAYDPLDVMSESTVGGQRRVYLYTAGNERIAVLEVTATGAVTGSTWTLRDASAKVLRKLSKDGAGTWRWDEDYIYRGAQLLAGEVPGNTLQFHLDHLGTPRVITGNGGARLSSHTYFPFGREVAAFSTPDAEVMKFTGHERDDVNLDYMHARYYLPFGGRFLSVDPGRDWDRHQPQSWNLYAYVRNNPVVASDPDGKKAIIRRDGNRISIEIPVRFTGRARTDERIAAFSNAVHTQWSGTFGPYEVTTRVTKGGFFDNQVRLDTTVGGASYTDNWRSAVIKTYPNPDVQAAVDAHEAGHLMRHDDKYDKKTKHPFPGWQGNIMAQVPGLTEEKNIEEILDGNRVRESPPRHRAPNDRAIHCLPSGTER